MRICLGIKDISGIGWRLRRGFRQAGVQADFINLYPHRHADRLPCDMTLPVTLRLSHKITHALHIKKVSGCRAWCLAKIFVLIKIMIFCQIIARYDVIILMSAFTLFSGHEYLDRLHLKLMKLMGKKVVLFVSGSDVRPNYIDGPFLDEVGDLGKILSEVIKKKEYISLLEDYSSYIIGAQCCSHFQQRLAVNVHSICLPTVSLSEFGERLPQTAVPQRKKPVILHAPSERKSKGTEFIRRVLAEIKAENIEFEYHEVSGLSRIEVFKALQRCDFVIDQAFSDTPFASFVSEASWFGKPSIVAGYYANVIARDVREEDVPPSVFVEPAQLKRSIRDMITDLDFRAGLGRRVFRHAQYRAHPRVVAERLLLLLNDKAPIEWFFNPAETKYVEGFGIEQNRLKYILKRYVYENGVEALLLSDKPSLEKNFIDFINSGQGESVKLEEIL